jgi:hypothetical protein
MKYYLVTFHGKLVARNVESRSLSQISFDAIADRDSLACVELEPDFARPTYRDFIGNAPGGMQAADVRHLGSQLIHIDPKTKTVSVERNGKYLSAQRSGPVDQDRSAVNGWERFVLCSDADLDFLQFLRGNRWIVRSTRALVAGERITLGDAATLEIGDLRIPLAFNAPLDRRTFPFRWIALADGWRIEELVLFDPVIFFVAFRQDYILSQLYVSLRSLAQIGKYDGRILIFTDRTHAEICENVPWFPPERISVADIPAQDWVGFVAGKYCVLEQPEVQTRQPVVYMDPDIVFNADVLSLLIPMAVSDRLTAPIELFSELGHSPSVGASLLQLDNAQPRYACGFNGGTIGIPNLPMHRHTLELIRRIIENFLALRGREAFSWVDQEAANYVSYKLAHFDLNDVSKCVRYGERATAKSLGPLTGLVHFWRCPRAERAGIMQTYLDLLLDHAGIPRDAP